MKKRRLLYALTSLFSLTLVISSCGKKGETTSGSSDECDPMFGCDSSSEDRTPPVELQDDPHQDYQIDENVSNANGSMSYEIFVRSFYDSNGDKIGDFNGITAKLDYLSKMGFKTLWLMPIHKSPSYHGYDVTDYYSVNPDYGTLSDFDNMVQKAKEKNIDIMIDFVINHSSDQNQWFIDSLKDFADNNTSATSKKDWYTWSTSPISSSYKMYNGTKYYYETYYDFGTMPAFNLDNEALRDEIDNVTKFWVQGHGVKAFRLDAAMHYYGSVEKTNEFMTWLENTGKKYDNDFHMVGECWTDGNGVLNYYNSECDSFFNFDSSIEGRGDKAIVSVVKRVTDAKKFGDSIEYYESLVKQKNPNAYSSYFLSNHDMDRISDNLVDTYAGEAANLLATLPGTPYMYYGEEIMMKGKRQGNDMSDARRRLPMVWSKDDKTGECGFPEKGRPDLDNNDQVKSGVNDEIAIPKSVLNAYRKAINVRNKYPIFKHGVFKNMTTELAANDKSVLAYKISLGNEYVIVVHNFSFKNQEMNALGTEILEQMNIGNKLPELNGGKLRIGARSSVIIH